MTRLGLVAFVVLSAHRVGAVEVPALALGSRIRVSSPTLGSGNTTGRFAGVEDGAILLEQREGSSPLSVRLTPDTKLERSIGRKSQTARGAIVGAAVGAAPGFFLTIGDYDTADGPSPAAVTAVGAASGALLGAAIGRAFKTDQWQEVALPATGVSVIPLRGGAAASVSVAWGGRR